MKIVWYVASQYRLFNKNKFNKNPVKVLSKNMIRPGGFPGGSEFTCNVGDPGSILGSGISPREGNGYSCPESSMDREALAG